MATSNRVEDHDLFIAQTRGAVVLPGIRKPTALLLDVFTHRAFLEIVNAVEDLRETDKPSKQLMERCYFAGRLLASHVRSRLLALASVISGPEGRRLLTAHSILLEMSREIRERLETLDFLYGFDPDAYVTVHALSKKLIEHFAIAESDSEITASFILAEQREVVERHERKG